MYNEYNLRQKMYFFGEIIGNYQGWARSHLSLVCVRQAYQKDVHPIGKRNDKYSESGFEVEGHQGLEYLR